MAERDVLGTITGMIITHSVTVRSDPPNDTKNYEVQMRPRRVLISQRTLKRKRRYKRF